MNVDVAIAGAGTAGAALALLAARAGLRVVCVDRRPLDEAGARWINAVPRWAFEEAGLEAPRAPELLGERRTFHLAAGWGPRRVTVRAPDVLDLDMRALVARLQAGAAHAGAHLQGRVTARGIENGALVTSAGTIRARVVVDASGLAGARLLPQEALGREDLCAAAQEVRSIIDPVGARAFLAEHAIAEGETLCFASIAGGFSIVNARVEGDEVHLLTGSVPGDGHPSGAQLLARFATEQRWIGPRRWGGARALPLRRPRTFGAGSGALLGDAGCQVFSAHGSGIGVGLVSARLLADALASGGDVATYAAAFERRFGTLFRVYDAFRRLSQRLSARQVSWLMRLGVLDEERVKAGLEQRLPRVPLPLGFG